jgi:hypothetical protein
MFITPSIRGWMPYMVNRRMANPMGGMKRRKAF